MDCTQLKDLLSDLLDDRLDEASRAQVESHLATCPECRAEREALEKTVAMVSDLPRLSAPADLAIRVLSQARQEEAQPPLATTARPRALPFLRAMGAAAVVLLFAAVGYRAVFYEPGTGLTQAPKKGMETTVDDPKEPPSLRGHLGVVGKELKEVQKEFRDNAGGVEAEKHKSSKRGLAEGEAAEGADDKLADSLRHLQKKDKGESLKKKEEQSRDKGPGASRKQAGRWAKSKADAKAEREPPGEPAKAPASKPGAPGFKGGKDRHPSGAPRPTAGKAVPEARRSRGRSADSRKPRRRMEEVEKLSFPRTDITVASSNVTADENTIHELLERAVNPHGYRPTPQDGPSEDAEENGGAPAEKDTPARNQDAGKPKARPAASKKGGRTVRTIQVMLTVNEYRAFMFALRQSRVNRNRVESKVGPRVLNILQEMAEKERKPGRGRSGGPGYAPGAQPAPGAPSPTPTPTPTPTPGPAPTPGSGGAPPPGPPPAPAAPPRGAAPDAWDGVEGSGGEQGSGAVPFNKRQRIVLRIVLVKRN